MIIRALPAIRVTITRLVLARTLVITITRVLPPNPYIVRYSPRKAK
jgi:hypothetical protein